MNLSAFPFVRLAFCFAVGIVAHHYLGPNLLITPILLVALFSAYMILNRLNSHRYKIWLGVISCILAFGLGTQRLFVFKENAYPQALFKKDNDIRAYKARVLSSPELKQNSTLIPLEVYQVLDSSDWQPTKGFINAYLPKTDSITLFRGDLVLIKGMPLEVKGPQNPGEFNYKNYLVYNRIYHQHYLKDGLKRIGHSPASFWVEISDRLRAYCAQTIKVHIQNTEAQAVILALSLGIKNELEDELVRAFSATGAMHVLAVSGLHVGIIYMILFQVFHKLGLSKKKYRWIMAILSIGFLWFYALLTGLSPSVLRAVTMFSFVALGKALFRKGNIYNTLAASAFALLWFNPYLIMSVGFQLSYLAVFGIVYLHPRLYALFDINNSLLDKAWSITCVSIAAQLATGPLSMLYFHQFPTYFLISNLFIIPAAFITLIGALLLFAFSFIPVLAIGMGWLLNQFVTLTNGLVYQVSSFPGSTIEGIRLSIVETWLVYFCLGGLILFLVHKKMNWVYLAFLCALCFAGIQIAHYSHFAKSYELSQLVVNNHKVLDIRAGFSSKLYADSAFMADQEKQRFHLHQKRILGGSNHRTQDDRLAFSMAESQLGTIIAFHGKSVLVLERMHKLNEALSFDYVFVDGRDMKFEREYFEQIQATRFILGGNLWNRTEEELIKYLEANQQPFHSVKAHGYFSQVWRE